MESSLPLTGGLIEIENSRLSYVQLRSYDERLRWGILVCSSALRGVVRLPAKYNDACIGTFGSSLIVTNNRGLFLLGESAEADTP